MRAYARQQTAALLERLETAVAQAARTGDAGSIHDIRTASLLTAAGVVRDCDIAIELARCSGAASRGGIVPVRERA